MLFFLLDCGVAVPASRGWLAGSLWCRMSSSRLHVRTVRCPLVWCVCCRGRNGGVWCRKWVSAQKSGLCQKFLRITSFDLVCAWFSVPSTPPPPSAVYVIVALFDT